MTDFTRPPLSYYAPPGIIRISPEALKAARDLDYTARRSHRIRDALVSFEWFTGGTLRRKPDGPETELGPSLGLGAGERANVPKEAIQTIDGLDLAIKIPAEVYNESRERLIVVDETQFHGLALR